MAVTMADITKLRQMSGAGMMDCKKALEEAGNDIEKAMEIIRKKGQAVAAKRSDREAAEGCVLVKAENGFGAIIALKCETDFVAKNEDFVKLAKDILDLAVANKCKTLDEVKALPMGKATVADAVVDRSGITGEGKGLCAVDVPAVKADKLRGGIGINSLLTIDITADVTLEIRSSLCRTVFADDCGAFFRPNAVIVGAEDHIEQIGIGRAVFTGDFREDTKIGCLGRRIRGLGRRFLAGRQAEYKNKPKKQGDQAGLCLHRESPFRFNNG